MSDTDKRTKKPLSLNQRHSRLLQDLSASQSKPPSSRLPQRGEDTDMKSQSNVEESIRVSAPPYADEFPQFSAIIDSDSPIEEKKPAKVKIQGRRRLCKAASASDDQFNDVDQLQDILEISDFTSPSASSAPKADGGGGDGDGGGNEIRSILDDLSSRLEFLSIEKPRNPSVVDRASISLREDTDGSAVVAEKKGSFLPFQRGNHSWVGGGDVDFGRIQDEIFSEHQEENVAVDVNVHKNAAKGKVTKRTGGRSKKPAVSEDNVRNEMKDNYARLIQLLSDDEDDTDAHNVVSDDEHAITLTGPSSTYKLPGKVGNMLFPHQRDGLRWLWSLYCQRKSGILGDDMGLGKTMQICGYLAGMFHSRLIKRVIVVAPKTLIPHWIKELTVVGLSENIREYFGTCPKTRQYELQNVLEDKGILLTTYDILRNNTKALSRRYSPEEDEEDGAIWDYMILDEGHLIKNPSTQRAKSLLEVPCYYRILISGTPLQNNLKELWALFNFCCPDLLGDKKEFKEKYEYPILRGNEKKATDREKRIGSNVAQELRERIRPYFLRRMKDEVFSENNKENSGKLSKKNELIVWLRLTTCQRHLYEAFLRSEIVLSSFDGSPLAALTILKKICDHPSLLTKRAAADVLEGMDSMLNQEDIRLAENYALHVADISEKDLLEAHGSVSCKISFILSLLENLVPEGHNVLIFSQTRKMLNLIQDSLIANGFEFQRIDGTTKATDRAKIVNNFQEGHGSPVFLLTSQVGGLGLTLTNADRVIVVDPAWNPSTDSQSVDRAYRIGQMKDVIVYRLMTCGTIEEKIYRKQIFKGGLFKTATEQKEQTRYFSQRDLMELFSLPKDGFDISPTQKQLHEEHSHQITMSDSLKSHIEFLESLGIGGVSHHSLLYSKTETVPDIPVEEETKRRETSARYWNSGSLPERNVNGAEFAFKPKDVQQGKSRTAAEKSTEMTKSAIKEQISRLSQLLWDKGTVARLPDRGARIQQQIMELNGMLKSGKDSEVIDLVDDVADELQRSLKVG